ncbi:MAG: BREX-2 system adenine-specific DNA-methyltransferase PglX, partial [Acidobacteriales bacterium]|nr:BREX-2 system adenine-specific DNA-methyltransferase PglX [Terriglobales bacterium]
MIDAKRLLAGLQGQQKKLEKDLREQIAALPDLEKALETDYKAARDAARTSETFSSWGEEQITQAAVAWLLSGVFLRFCEDNRLIPAPLLAGPGEGNRQARDAAREYFSAHPTENERHYLEHCFNALAQYPAVAGLYVAHNPLFRMPLSYDAAKALVEFWQRVDPDSGVLVHDFTDPALNTRFLGDLYQDLSESARKRYALLQTPEFVEEFILERTLEPAIQTFGIEAVRMIDPTCGSGHFLLGSFHALLSHWDKVAPELDIRERVMHALGAIYGVDLNPFAVAIARFRLMVAALKATGIRKLKEAPGWKFNLTTGDSLLHGRRFGELNLGGDDLEHRFAHVYAAEDRAEIDRILGQQYHVVVGNPPYITVNDSALNDLYRQRYRCCHMKYSLGVPFTERFFQLSLSAANQPAGYVGLITTNSFMKREFGKKLIEVYLPQQDLTHVIDTSGAYIPGHGTPTVVLFARHRRPVGETLRAVLGIRGEPSTPPKPAEGQVWSSILRLMDRPDSANEFVSVTNMQRRQVATHPWSLHGGAAPDVLSQLDGCQQRLTSVIESIGFMAITGEDDAYALKRVRSSRDAALVRSFGEGNAVRHWTVVSSELIRFPYNEGEEGLSLATEYLARSAPHFWPLRTNLRSRLMFGKTTEESGLHWAEYRFFLPDRYLGSYRITFAEVATHNHFVLDRGGKVFNQTAPVIKLPAGEDEAVHLGLLGLLNSSTACFWLKQVCHNKGSTVDAQGARQTTVEFENFYQLAGTRVKEFPLPTERPIDLARAIDHLALQRGVTLPYALSERLPLSRDELDAANARADSLFRQMIAWQEELDWWCYRAYGLTEDDLTYQRTPPELKLGERAFEILLARQFAAGETETTWFLRHDSTPITYIPAHWPADYRALVKRRIALIESSAWIRLVEKPEYKRR